MIIDLWYGDKLKEIDDIDIVFYPNIGVYRGNLYKRGVMVGDYSTKDSLEIEKRFYRLFKEGKK